MRLTQPLDLLPSVSSIDLRRLLQKDRSLRRYFVSNHVAIKWQVRSSRIAFRSLERASAFTEVSEGPNAPMVLRKVRDGIEEGEAWGQGLQAIVVWGQDFVFVASGSDGVALLGMGRARAAKILIV